MGESNARRLPASSENIRTSVRASNARRPLGTSVRSVRAVPNYFGKPKIGIIAEALWPDAPPAGLAKVLKCTKRHAALLIDGKRKLNARAAWAILGEIIS